MYLKKQGPSVPSELPGPYLICNTFLKGINRSLNIVIILLVLTSCGSMKINGIDVSKSHRRAVGKRETAAGAAALIVGYAVGMHFKHTGPKK
jgi:hypothetical protein